MAQGDVVARFSPLRHHPDCQMPKEAMAENHVGVEGGIEEAGVPGSLQDKIIGKKMHVTNICMNFIFLTQYKIA